MAQGAAAMMTRVFTSKKDAWLVSLIWGSAILPLVAGLLIVWTDAKAGSYLITISVITFTLILAASFPLYYELTEHELVIRSGLFRWRVPLDGIEEIRPTRSILSAPALSIDRLHDPLPEPEGRLRPGDHLAQRPGRFPARGRRPHPRDDVRRRPPGADRFSLAAPSPAPPHRPATAPAVKP